MKYNGFYFWMFKHPMKKVLAEKYGAPYAAEIMKKSRPVYRQLVERAVDIGDGNPMGITSCSRWPSSRRMSRAGKRSSRRLCRR